MKEFTLRVTVKMSLLLEGLLPPETLQEGSRNTNYVKLVVEVPHGTRLSDLISGLGQRYPKLAEEILAGEEGQPPLAVVILNGKITSGSELATELDEGDVVTLLPIFMGG